MGTGMFIHQEHHQNHLLHLLVGLTPRSTRSLHEVIQISEDACWLSVGPAAPAALRTRLPSTA